MQSQEHALDRRTVWAWSLYDFANSSFAVLMAAVFSLYYSDVIVEPHYQQPGDTAATGRGDLFWGFTVAASMLAVALSSPLVGGIADHTGRRKRLLILYTCLGIGSVLGLTFLGPGGAAMILAASVLAAVANFAFEGAIVFYNAYLPDIAPPSHRGRVSALGFAVGYAGSLVALGIAWPLLDAEAWAWVWVAIGLQWLVFSLPAFRLLPADQPSGLGLAGAAKRGFHETRQTLRDIWGMRDLRRFLLAFFIYMDGVITVVWFAGRYARNTLEFTLPEILGMLVVVQVTALVGSVLMGKPTDRLGPRWTVRLALCWWVGVAVAAYVAESKVFFLVVAGLAGLGLGSIQAASRAFMARLIPHGRESEMFGFYALCGKTGSVLGPVVFGVVTWLSDGNQRPAVLVVAVFYFAGLLILKGVSDKPVA